MAWSGMYGENMGVWTDSEIYQNINGSSFLTNTTYVPNTTWKNKIATVEWKYVDLGYGTGLSYSQSASQLYIIEVENATSSVNAKIAIWYAHDYAYAYQSGGLNCSTNSSNCKTSWIFLGLNDSSAPESHEFIMSRNTYYNAFGVLSTGTFGGKDYPYALAVRPVFYLSNSINYVSGTGTSTDPFIIS